MRTHFATPERSTQAELDHEIGIISNSPVVTKMLQAVGGLLAVLDTNRQIVALNDTFLDLLGVKEAAAVFGLRPGEAVRCIHAHNELAGCGTSKHCSACGAVISIVASLDRGEAVEQTCSISTEMRGVVTDLFFSVKAYPLLVEGKQFVLLFLQDITAAQQRAALERTFFHDVNNMLQMLVGASELLASEYSSDLSKTIYHASIRLQDEIAIQRCLTRRGSSNYVPVWKNTSTKEIFEDLQHFFTMHPLCNNRFVQFTKCTPERLQLRTDASLLWRILHNMLLNALEATEEGKKIQVWFEQRGENLLFQVWNEGMIPLSTANRIFERNFSTKGGEGRGLGTYSMKYFGESILKGKVSFTSNKSEGTTFYFSHPIS